MRKLAALFVLLAGLSAPAVAQQSAAKDCGSSTACSLSLPSVPAGALVVAAIRAGRTPQITAPGFTQLVCVTSPDPHVLCLFYQIAAASGAVTVNASAPNASTLRMAMSWASGPWQNIPPPTSAAIGTSTTPVVPLACLTADLCILAVGASDTVTLSGPKILAQTAGKLFLTSGMSSAKLSATVKWSAVSAQFTKAVTLPASPTATLSASPGAITAGQNSLLSWTTTNAATAEIDNGIGAVTPVGTGFRSVIPAGTTTYTLTATGVGGTAAASATVTVSAPRDTTPPTVSITAPGPGSVLSGIVDEVASVSDDSGIIASFQFLIDGTPFGAPLTTQPFSARIDCALLPIGMHQLGARATDAAGNVGSAVPVDVIVGGQLFSVDLAYDDGSAYAPGGTVTVAEIISATETSTHLTTNVSTSGHAAFRWNAVIGAAYLILLKDSSGATLWTVPTMLVPPTSGAASFSGAAIALTFSKATGVWTGVKLSVSY